MTNYSGLKFLTSDIVAEKAIELIEENGETTTLEIKQALRGDGYFALQTGVSNYMDLLAEDGRFEYVDNGTYREYSIPSVDDDDVSVAVPDDEAGSRLTVTWPSPTEASAAVYGAAYPDINIISTSDVDDDPYWSREMIVEVHGRYFRVLGHRYAGMDEVSISWPQVFPTTVYR